MLQSCSTQEKVVKNQLDTLAMPISISNEILQTIPINLPNHQFPIFDFAIIKNSLIAIPFEGGIFSPGLDAWIVKPGKQVIFSASYSTRERSMYFVVNGTNFTMLKSISQFETENPEINDIVSLPKGIYNVYVESKDEVYVVGRKKGDWVISLWDGNEVTDIYSSETPIQAFAASGNSVLFGEGTSLKLMENGKVETIKSFRSEIDGIAVSNNGDIYLSFKSGIIRLSPNKQTVITTGIHGPLKTFQGDLYVLWQERNKILVLSKKIRIEQKEVEVDPSTAVTELDANTNEWEKQRKAEEEYRLSELKRMEQEAGAESSRLAEQKRKEQAEASPQGTFQDIRDGKIYKTIKIRDQVWMAENLNVDKFQNGDQIYHAKTDQDWFDAGKYGKPAWCYYDNDPANGITLGKLYNWYAVNDPRGLAPEGWHIPMFFEWKNRPQESNGFSGLAGGQRLSSGLFVSLGENGFWWTSSVDQVGLEKKIMITSLFSYFNFSNRIAKDCGLSVRCVLN